MERLAVLASIEEGGDWEESWSPMSILHNKDIYVTAQGETFSLPNLCCVKVWPLGAGSGRWLLGGGCK